MVLLGGDVGIVLAATARKRSSQNGMVWMMPFDLVADVSFFLRRREARRRSASPGRSRERVRIVSWTTISWSVPGNIRPPISEYSPSLFSRTIRKSMAPGLRRAATARPRTAGPAAGSHIAGSRGGSASAASTATPGRARSASRRRRGRSHHGRRCGRQPVLRHHAAEAGMVVAAPVLAVPGDVDAKARAAASTTRMPSGTTSLPMPSPSITAILKPAICSSVATETRAGASMISFQLLAALCAVFKADRLFAKPAGKALAARLPARVQHSLRVAAAPSRTPPSLHRSTRRLQQRHGDDQRHFPHRTMV